VRRPVDGYGVLDDFLQFREPSFGVEFLALRSGSLRFCARLLELGAIALLLGSLLSNFSGLRLYLGARPLAPGNSRLQAGSDTPAAQEKKHKDGNANACPVAFDELGREIPRGTRLRQHGQTKQEPLEVCVELFH